VLYGNEAKVTFMTLETLSSAAILFYHDIRNPTITNNTHEHKPFARCGNALSTMKTLSTIAKKNATKAKVKRSMHKMNMIHVRKNARYIERVTGVDVMQILKEKGVEL